MGVLAHYEHASALSIIKRMLLLVAKRGQHRAETFQHFAQRAYAYHIVGGQGAQRVDYSAQMLYIVLVHRKLSFRYCWGNAGQ